MTKSSETTTAGTGVSPRRKATETRLLDAAERVFAARGFDAAGVKEIAETARANVALINRYFGGKQGLLFAICERFMARKAHGPLPYPPQKSLRDEIHAYLRHRLREDRRDDRVVRLMVSRITIDDAFRRRATESFATEADANFRERVERLRDGGRVAADADIDRLFTMVAFFSFSTNLFGVLIQGRPEAEIDALFADFADRMGRDTGR